MTENKRRYDPPEDEPMRLDEVLEPFDRSAPVHGGYDGQPYGDYGGEPLYDDSAYGQPPYAQPDDGETDYDDGDPYAPQDELDGDGLYEDAPYEDDEYSDYHEALDHEGRVRTAIGVFDTVSTLVGVVVILVLAAMLFSLISWLQADVTHSLTLLQSGIQ